MNKLRFDETGKVYGRLTVAHHLGSGFWLCECSCGSTVKVSGGHLRDGDTTSCGCRKSDISRVTLTTHGKSHSPPYNSYLSAKSRCTKPSSDNFQWYGGRGVQFLLPPFAEFWEHMEESWFDGATLGRIDNNGHYEMSNVRWETWHEQARNTRASVWLTYGHVRKVLAEWVDILGVSRKAIRGRMRRGQSFEHVVELVLSRRGITFDQLLSQQ